MHWFSRVERKEKGNNKPQNGDDKCFQYTVAVALSLDEIKKDPLGVSNIKPFINNCNWESINYLSKIEGWKRVKK